MRWLHRCAVAVAACAIASSAGILLGFVGEPQVEAAVEFCVITFCRHSRFNLRDSPQSAAEDEAGDAAVVRLHVSRRCSSSVATRQRSSRRKLRSRQESCVGASRIRSAESSRTPRPPSSQHSWRRRPISLLGRCDGPPRLAVARRADCSGCARVLHRDERLGGSHTCRRLRNGRSIEAGRNRCSASVRAT